MKNMVRLGSLILVLCLLLSGCASRPGSHGGEAATEGPGVFRGYNVYYASVDGLSLVQGKFKPQSTNFDGILKEILAEFEKPTEANVASALPRNVKMNGYTMGVDNLTVDFDSAYLSLTNVQEIILRAALVKTLAELPGVFNVSMTVEGQPLTEEGGTVIQPMNENMFIDSQDGGINSYHYVTLNLYFADETGEKIAREMRNVYYSSNLITERVIIEQIIAGPADSHLLPVTDGNVHVESVRISDGVCVVNLDESFNKELSNGVTAETTLYAFVNAICEACDVDGVRFEIGGSSDVRFRNEISLAQTFKRNQDIIADYAEEIVEPATDVFLDDAGQTIAAGTAGVGIDPALSGVNN